MQGRIPSLAGGGGRTGYKCVLAQVLHEKKSLPFLFSRGYVLSERKLRKFGEVDFSIKPKSAKTLRATKNLEVLKDVEKNLDRYDNGASCSIL